MKETVNIFGSNFSVMYFASCARFVQLIPGRAAVQFIPVHAVHLVYLQLPYSVMAEDL